MIKSVTVAAIDLAFSNTGVAIFKYSKDLKYATTEVHAIESFLIKTTKKAGKDVRKTSDNFRRGRILSKELKDIERKIDIFAVEFPMGSDNANIQIQFGIAIGAFATIDKPVIQVTPYEAKHALTGRKKATKDQMILTATKQYPSLNWITSKISKREGGFTDDNEHMADACGVFEAALLKDDFHMATSGFLR